MAAIAEGLGALNLGGNEPSSSSIHELNQGAPEFVPAAQQAANAAKGGANPATSPTTGANGATATPAPEEENLPCRVYVGNINYDTTEDDLRTVLETVGPVVSLNMPVMYNGRGRGYALAEFGSAAEATRAVAELHDHVLDDRKIFLREDRGANTKPPRVFARNANGGGAANGNGAARPPQGERKQFNHEPGTKVFVGNLAWSVKWWSLKDYFAQFGSVEYANVMTMQDGRSKGFGIVRFSTPAEAEAAISQADGTTLEGRDINVRLDRRG